VNLTAAHRTVPSVCAVSRDWLGRRVRETWIRWARTQPDPKPSWLAPWEDLGATDREADRLIGEDLFGLGWEEGQAYGREHVIHVNAEDAARMRAWLARPGGALCLGRVTLESCGGGLLVRTGPFRAGNGP
jgi:hypothetical protein